MPGSPGAVLGHTPGRACAWGRSALACERPRSDIPSTASSRASVAHLRTDEHMKFFIDTGDTKEIRDAVAMGVIDGVTTNPSLVAKTGRKYVDVVREICDLVDGPISAEVLSTTYDEMMREAHAWAKIHPNIVVKLPLTLEGLRGV